MSSPINDRELLSVLERAAEENVRRHVAEAQDWESHDLVPWESGRNFAFLGGDDWAPEQSTLTEVEKLAATIGVLIADNLPAYHRDLAFALSSSGTWWEWVGRWTAEENRHAIVLRDFLMTTRAVDPVELERIRVEHMTLGYSAPSLHLADVLVKYAFDEVASSLRHKRTADLCSDDRLAAILRRIAQDDDLQAVFFRNLVSASLDATPDQTVRAIADRIADFAIPVVDLPGRGNSTAELAKAGIYDAELERSEVFRPLLEHWNVFERTDFGPEGEKARDEIASVVALTS